MFYPKKTEFMKLAKKGNLIPVYAEFLADYETPISCFAKMEADGYAFLLESVEGGEKIARYSFIGASSGLIFESTRDNVVLKEGKLSKSYKASDPLAELEKIMSRYKYVKIKGLPRFCGGFVGYLGYGMVRFFEKLPDRNADDLRVPDAIFMLTDTLLIFDHVDHMIKIVSNVHAEGDYGRCYDEAVKKIKDVMHRLKSTVRKTSPKIKRKTKELTIKSNFTRKGFEDAVCKAKEYIRKGDIIQVVLSQRVQIPIESTPLEIYRALRSVNPSPYMYYLKLGNFSLVGSSPEVMVRCEEGVVEVRPIAGTRPRGSSEAEDKELETELLADPKEKAEHIMLVDLGRNDIGRVCDYKTVMVPELMTIEKYSHVMHIVSDVSGKLSKGKNVFDVIRATFPAGTVSGAPKVRAMEIIDELENKRRATYAGAVGYFSFSGNLDTCITIRTILIKEKMAYIQVGAGLVADSDPANEYNETMNKAKALVKAIEMAERGLE